MVIASLTGPVGERYLDDQDQERDDGEVRHTARRPRAPAPGLSSNYNRWDTVLANRVIKILSYTHYPGASLISEGPGECEATLETDEKTDEETSANKVTIKGE